MKILQKTSWKKENKIIQLRLLKYRYSIFQNKENYKKSSINLNIHKSHEKYGIQRNEEPESVNEFTTKPEEISNLITVRNFKNQFYDKLIAV